jgi:hypothetical protein
MSGSTSVSGGCEVDCVAAILQGFAGKGLCKTSCVQTWLSCLHAHDLLGYFWPATIALPVGSQNILHATRSQDLLAVSCHICMIHQAGVFNTLVRIASSRSAVFD